MPTYEITAPNGKVYEVSGEGTAEQALASFKKQWAATNAPKAVAPTETPDISSDMSTGEKMLVGAGAATDRAIRGVKKLFGADTSTGDADAELYKEYGKQLGTAGTVGEIGADVAMLAVPGSKLLKGANALRKALATRGMAGTGTAAMLGTDLGGNAAINAAVSPENRDTAAMLGAGGAAGGRVLARTLGGAMRESVAPQAQRLIDAGIHITPGQALTGPQAGIVARTIRGAEDKITSIPVLGDVIANAQQRGLKSFNTNRINDALVPIGAKVKTAGVEALDAADQHISDAYDKVIPLISIDPAKGLSEIIAGQARAAADPLFDIAHTNKLEMFVDRRIMPLLAGGTTITGDVAKKLDSELGELGRKYMNSGVGNEPLGRGFLELRKSWRSAMEGATPKARQSLQDADQAFAKLLPLLKAGEKSAHGVFTPKQLSDALRTAKMQPDQITEAARQVLPNSVPDTGTAGRQLFANLVSPERLGAGTAVATGIGGMAPAAVAALGAGAMYTKTGLRALTEGAHPLVEVLRSKLPQQLRKGDYNPATAEAVARNLIGRSLAAAGKE